MLAMQVDGIEGALGRAQTAADALVLVHDARAAVQAARRLGLDLLLGERLHVLAERALALGPVVMHGVTAARGVVAAKVHVVLVELTVAALVAADGERGVLHKAVERHRGLMTGGDGIDGELGAGVDVTAHEDVGLGGLVGLGVGHGALATTQLDGRALKQVAPLDGLADGEHHAVRGYGARLALVVGRVKAALVVEDAQAALEHDLTHATGFIGVNRNRAPTAGDVHAVLVGLHDLLDARGHVLGALQAEHLHVLGAQARRGAGHVDGHVAAAHHDGPAGKRGGLAAVLLLLGHGAQEVHRHRAALDVLTRDAGQTAALATDRHVERLEALLAQLGERHVATDLDAVANLGAHLLDDGDLGLDHALLQLVAGNAVGEHAARAGVLLEDDRLVALLGQVERAGESRGAGADDGDFLLEATFARGGHALGHVAVLGNEVLLGDELLDLVNRHGSVNAAAGTGVLAATVADTAADGGQRILALDEGERVAVPALSCELEVALNRDMRRARRLAGRGSRVVSLDAVLVAVVRAPLLRAPLHGVRQLLLGVLRHLARACGAELLAQLDRARRADLDATAARHALVGLGARHVRGAGEVGRVEELRRAQGVAHVHVAVADGEDLVLAVDVRDLMDEAVVLGLAQDVVDLLARDVVAAVGLDHVIGHIAHGDAPVVGVVAARLAQDGAAHAAAARAGGILAVVLVEPVLDMLDGNGAVLHGDGLLNRDDVHADACAARRHHRRGSGECALRGLLEELGEHRMLLQLGHAHVEELRRAGHEHG